MSEFAVGKVVSIYMGGATSPTSVAVRMAHFVVEEERPKAIKVKAMERKGWLWLPKKGLKKSPYWDETYGGSYELAAWFREQMDSYSWGVLNRVAEVAAISVAA